MTVKQESRMDTKPRREPPFFVLGCSRSGTTLTSRILDSHSKLAVYHESHFYHLLRHDLHRYGDLRQPRNLRRLLKDAREIIQRQKRMEPPTEEALLQALTAPTFAGVLAAILHLYARQQGKFRGGDKTPGHHSYLGEILGGIPGSRAIFIMRDPRDTVAALREKFGFSLKGAAALWNAAFESYTRFRPQVHLVRYEELVRSPSEITAGICSYLGETYEADMLNFFQRIPPRLANIRYNQDLLGPVDPRHIGRFRGELPRGDIEFIEAACVIGMEAMGYEFSGAKPKAATVKPLTKVEFAIDRLRFYGWNWERWRRGSIRWKIALRLRVRYFLSWERFRS